MTAMDVPRHRTVERAMRIARVYCDGKEIDGGPAFTHAVAVAKTLVEFVPDAQPELVAACVLHDAPGFAPASVKPHLEDILDRQVAPGVWEIVEDLWAEHEAMRPGSTPQRRNPEVMRAIAADKIVAFKGLLKRGGNKYAFWFEREVLAGMLPYFRAWIGLADADVPAPMVAEVRRLFEEIEKQIARVRASVREGARA